MIRRLSIAVLVTLLAVARSAAAEPNLTFFAWSDQHVQTDGSAEHLIPAIDAMNGLPGREFPAGVGGVVPRPAFVFGCGDISEWPSHAAKNAYEKLILQRLEFPSHDTVGNHDSGGASPSKTITGWLIRRHGPLSHTFDSGGVRFVVVYSEYDESLGSPAQPITKEALDFLKASLAEVPKNMPVIVATHLCYDAITNRDEVVDALGDADVLMVLGGHYHKAKVDRYREIDFVQLPSPAVKNAANQVTVIRVTSDRVVAVPFDYQAEAWVDDPRKVLDTQR